MFTCRKHRFFTTNVTSWLLHLHVDSYGEVLVPYYATDAAAIAAASATAPDDVVTLPSFCMEQKRSKYVCLATRCRFTTSLQLVLEEHLRCHVLPQPFRCSRCHVQLDVKELLRHDGTHRADIARNGKLAVQLATSCACYELLSSDSNTSSAMAFYLNGGHADHGVGRNDDLARIETTDELELPATPAVNEAVADDVSTDDLSPQPAHRAAVPLNVNDDADKNCAKRNVDGGPTEADNGDGNGDADGGNVDDGGEDDDATGGSVDGGNGTGHPDNGS